MQHHAALTAIEKRQPPGRVENDDGVVHQQRVSIDGFARAVRPADGARLGVQHADLAAFGGDRQIGGVQGQGPEHTVPDVGRPLQPRALQVDAEHPPVVASEVQAAPVNHRRRKDLGGRQRQRRGLPGGPVVDRRTGAVPHHQAPGGGHRGGARGCRKSQAPDALARPHVQQREVGVFGGHRHLRLMQAGHAPGFAAQPHFPDGVPGS